MTMATYFQSSCTCRWKWAHSDRGQALGNGECPAHARPSKDGTGAMAAC